MLRSEAIRLVSQPEQSHEGFTREDLPTASSHDRGHAAAQIGDQDARGLHSCRAALRILELGQHASAVPALSANPFLTDRFGVTDLSLKGRESPVAAPGPAIAALD